MNYTINRFISPLSQFYHTHSNTYLPPYNSQPPRMFLSYIGTLMPYLTLFIPISSHPIPSPPLPFHTSRYPPLCSADRLSVNIYFYF